MAIAAAIDNDTGLCIMSNLKPPGTKRQICTDSTLSLGFEHLEESEDAADCIQKSAIILCWKCVYTSKPSVSRADPTCAETVVVVAICGPASALLQPLLFRLRRRRPLTIFCYTVWRKRAVSEVRAARASTKPTLSSSRRLLLYDSNYDAGKTARTGVDNILSVHWLWLSAKCAAHLSDGI